MNKYRELILVNGCLLLVLGILFLYAIVGGEWNGGYPSGSLGGLLVFLIAMWALPFANAIRFGILFLSAGPRYLIVAYGLLALIFFTLGSMMWLAGIGAFKKIGG
jgi:hypothetical protein